MTDLRERVARALIEKRGYDPDATELLVNGLGETREFALWEHYTDEADAAIAVCAEHELDIIKEAVFAWILNDLGMAVKVALTQRHVDLLLARVAAIRAAGK